MRRTALLSAFVALTLPAASLAQESTRIGLGLGLQNLSIAVDDEFGILTAVTPQVYVPIELSGSMILEPGIGFIRFHEETDSDFGDMEGTFTVLRLGAGLLFVHARPERGRIYVGPRLGITRFSSEVEIDGEEADDDSRTDLFLAGVAGGEFFLMPAFSLGGEVGLSYTRAGDDEDDAADSSASVINMITEFRIRWYFR